jgi:hypothetical protein
MGWEKRGNKSYYYRKVRDGNRVRSVYVGHDFYAESQAKLIENDRWTRRDEREDMRGMQRADKDLDRQIKDVENTVSALTQASFSAAGYHNHRGQWRKKRHDANAITGAARTQ